MRVIQGSQTKLKLTINGTEREANIDTRMLLVEALRDAFDITGPKVGCATGDCGACTVSLDGQITKSCLKLAVAVDGANVVTIEGLEGPDGLSPVQQAFWDELGFQCGFCLSGMLFAAEDLLRLNPHPGKDEIRSAIAGNLCRCTGYEKIVSAIMAAASAVERQTATRALVLAPPAER